MRWCAFSWQLSTDAAQKPRWVFKKKITEYYSKRKVQFLGKRHKCVVCICTNIDNIQFWSRSPLTVVVWLTLPRLLAELRKVFLLMQPAWYILVSGQFLHSIHQAKRGEEDTQGYTNTKLHSGRGEIKGETRLLCHWVCSAQIILILCLCWTCIPLPHPLSPQ